MAIHALPISLVAFLTLFLFPAATAQEALETSTLQPGKPIEQELAGGQAHSYHLNLDANQYLRVIVKQQGIDVVVAMYGYNGQKLAEVNSQNSVEGPELLSIITEVSGRYRLEVRSEETNAPAGSYRVLVGELRLATAQDRARTAAQKAFREAEQLAHQGNEASKRQAIIKYQEALSHWQAAGDQANQAETLHQIGRTYNNLSELQKALDFFNQALWLRRTVSDQAGEAYTLNAIGGVYAQLGEQQKATDFFERALPLSRAVKNKYEEAKSLNNLGFVSAQLGENQKALDYYSQALPLWREVGDRGAEAYTLNNLGMIYEKLGEIQRALSYHSRALPLRRTVGDRVGEAQTLNNIGTIYDVLGMPQRALDYYDQARQLVKAAGFRYGEAYTLSNIALVYHSLGEKQKALERYKQALSLRQMVGDRVGEAITLNNIGGLYRLLGSNEQALSYSNQALELSRKVGARPQEADALWQIGLVSYSLGQYQRALSFQSQALSLYRVLGSQRGEAGALYAIAQVNRAQGELIEARTNIEQALEIIESLRANVAAQDLRTSYFATVQDYYGLNIDVLMRLHQQQPKRGFDALALQTSERARARSLLELLSEARADIRRGLDPALLERERSLQQLLNGKEQARMQLLNRKHTPEQAAAAEKEIRELTTQYQELQAQIRTSSPRYAALTQPQPLTLEEIQQQALDAHTMLLEYALGDERSYLWAVTPTAILSFELPKRDEIEELAQHYYELLSQPGMEIAETATALSQMLLGPVAGQLEEKRLLIVASGALQYVPFAALPKPAASNTATDGSAPLIVAHEIISLPSASTLAMLRKELAGREPAPKVLAILADPVFSSEDLRVKRRQLLAQKTTTEPTVETRDLEELLARSAEESGVADASLRIPRLPGTRREAAAILALVPRTERKQALDFEANRAAATSEEISQYRIVHFATHGLLNSTNPGLSGIVLSLVDEQGQPQNGFLRLHEIYNLKLHAELVVLSACQTGLGKEIKGEGLVGLTRGFMYAGTARVVASLWKVDDRATAELMKQFYREMTKEGMRPAAALRRAQVAMWKQKRWESAYYWAAFMLQGEWK